MDSKTPIKIRFCKTLHNLEPSRLIAVKGEGDSDFLLYVTDKQGIPFPLRTGSGAGITIKNTDGNLDITGTTTVTINVEQTLLDTINSALKSGDNISELVNDEGYLVSSDLVDTIPFLNLSDVTDNSYSGKNGWVPTVNEATGELELKEIVTSVFNRIGDVEAESGDYTTNQITETSTKVFVTPSEKTAITHSNRSILDAITASFTTALKTAYDGAVTWISTNGTNLLNHLTNTSNPHNTTASQVGAYTTSQVDDLLDRHEKFIFSKANEELGYHTGDMLETVLLTIPISGGEFQSGDWMNFLFNFNRTGGNGTVRFRVGTTGTVSDSLIGTYNYNQNFFGVSRGRVQFFNSNTLYVVNASASAVYDVSAAGSSLSQITLDSTQNWYLSVTVQLGANTDTISCVGGRLSKIKSF